MKTIHYGFVLFLASAHLFGAELAGTVVDQNGNPISGASVSVVRQAIFLPATPGAAPQLAAGEVMFGASWTTDGNGNFQATSVPAGNYLLCIEKLNSPLLDPCSWSTPIKVNNLQATEQRSVGNLSVQLGTLVQINVSDPSALLPEWNDLSSDGGLIVAFTTATISGHQRRGIRTKRYL